MPALDRTVVLEPNPVRRFYRGAGALAAFRRAAEYRLPDETCEDWVGSVTPAWRPPGSARGDEGLSRVRLDGEREAQLADLVAADPDAALGPARAVAWAGSTGVLVKLLDAGERLPIHCHPSREFAGQKLGSPFGKAEAWLVLAATRLPGAEPPHIRLGLRHALTRDRLGEIIGEQQIGALLELMPPIETRAGDVWFVPPGVPHAIGPGVFMVEVQEPSDFSIVAEHDGFPIARSEAHLGRGWPTMLDAFDRSPMTPARLARLRVTPGAPRAHGGITETPLLSGDALRYFAAARVEIRGAAEWPVRDRFAIGVVVGGDGRLGPIRVARGMTFAVPVAASPIALVGEPRLEIIVAAGGEEPPGR